MSILCDEIFDEQTHPSDEEVREYAKKIGIDPDQEKYLLPLAMEGLMKALPSGWTPCYDDDAKTYYYYHKATGRTQWEHPLDAVYRNLVQQTRTYFNEDHKDDDAMTLNTSLSRDDISLDDVGSGNVMHSHAEANNVVCGDNDNNLKPLVPKGDGALFLKGNKAKKKSNLVTDRHSRKDSETCDKSEHDDCEDKKSVRFNLDIITMERENETYDKKTDTGGGLKRSRFTVHPVKEVNGIPTDISANRDIQMLSINSAYQKDALSTSTGSSNYRSTLNEPDFLDDILCNSKKHFHKLESEKRLELEETFKDIQKKLETEYEDKLSDFRNELSKRMDFQKTKLIEQQTSEMEKLKTRIPSVEIEQNSVIEKGQSIPCQELELKVKASDSCEWNVNKCNCESSARKELEMLADKYRCLKAKYVKLKCEVRQSLERRQRNKAAKRQQCLTLNNNNATGSETERSSANESLHARPPISKSMKNFNKCLNVSQQEQSVKVEGNAQSEAPVMEATHKHLCSPVENLRKQLQKLEELEDQYSQTYNSTINDSPYYIRYPFTDGDKVATERYTSELEFVRHRVHLERDSIRRAKENFRKHKSILKQKQSDVFLSQCELRNGNLARRQLDQFYKEEKELSDMEVNLHRTRSLLGEKIIRLRHLEYSLDQVSQTARLDTKQRTPTNVIGSNVEDTDKRDHTDDGTLSDLSSHSASSGISSSDAYRCNMTTDKNIGQHTSGLYQSDKSNWQKDSWEFVMREPPDIAQSLENLNFEIREIWEVLRKQVHQVSGSKGFQDNDIHGPDVAFKNTETGFSTCILPHEQFWVPTLSDRLNDYRKTVTTWANDYQASVMTPNQEGAIANALVERTRRLRQWLRQTSHGSPGNFSTSLPVNSTQSVKCINSDLDETFETVPIPQCKSEEFD